MTAAGAVRTLFCISLLTVILIAPSWAWPDQTAGAPGEHKGFDGPAELPRSYVKTLFADTPTPGEKLQAKDADGFRDALRKAGRVSQTSAGPTPTEPDPSTDT